MEMKRWVERVWVGCGWGGVGAWPFSYTLISKKEGREEGRKAGGRNGGKWADRSPDSGIGAPCSLAGMCRFGS